MDLIQQAVKSNFRMLCGENGGRQDYKKYVIRAVGKAGVHGRGKP